MSVYNVVITSIIVIVAANVLGERTTLAYVIITTLVFVSTTTTLCLLFIPKVDVIDICLFFWGPGFRCVEEVCYFRYSLSLSLFLSSSLVFSFLSVSRNKYYLFTDIDNFKEGRRRSHCGEHGTQDSVKHSQVSL